MTFFQIPKAITVKLTSAMARFWCSAMETKRVYTGYLEKRCVGVKMMGELSL